MGKKGEMNSICLETLDPLLLVRNISFYKYTIDINIYIHIGMFIPMNIGSHPILVIIFGRLSFILFISGRNVKSK